MKCYRKILRVSYKDHVTNEDVCAKIQQAIGPHEDRLTIVKRRKLKWYGHVSRLSGLAKTILQGTVKGGRRPSSQKKKWEDNVREWTGPEFAKSKRAVKKQKNWGNWFWSHLWCPNDPPPRLRDRWGEEFLLSPKQPRGPVSRQSKSAWITFHGNSTVYEHLSVRLTLSALSVLSGGVVRKATAPRRRNPRGTAGDIKKWFCLSVMLLLICN